MALLVAYEDSDSSESLNQNDDDDESPPHICPAVSSRPEKPDKDVMLSNATSSHLPITSGMYQTILEYNRNPPLYLPLATTSRLERRIASHLPSQPRGCVDTAIQYRGAGMAPNISLGEMQPPCSMSASSVTTPSRQSKSQTPQTSERTLGPATKRQSTEPSGIRPYVPKRHKLATPVQNVDCGPSGEEPVDQTRVTNMFSEVSEKVKPYLAHEPGRARTPRRLLMSLVGHQGPVNTIQWNPVPHFSHLLLSASMDRTVKVWHGAESGQCLKVYIGHAGAVRTASWTPCGRSLLTGSFDNTALLTDAETGQQIVKVDNQFKVMCVSLHPRDNSVFLCGGYSPEVKAWDSRSCKVVKGYKAGIQQTLDILFLSGGAEFITSTDSVSRDSAERTLIAWDYRTTAKLSNQIYHEKYTCPSLALHPTEDTFVAQSNGNYVAVFSSQRPYRMNKRRRYEGHKVEGYAARCELSADGTLLASGSSTGHAHFYDFQSARTLLAVQAHSHPCLCVSQHPVLPATAATCDWAGEIKVWH